jgi:limonene-1,2-epoxide hydrolase
MSNRKEAAVKQFLALFHATELDLPAIRAALADEARWQPVVPLARTVQGAQAICDEAARQYKLYADCDCQLLHIATVGNTVFTERVDSVRMLHDDRTVLTRLVGVFDLDDNDKITFWREYWDMMDIAGQIGISGEEMLQMMDTSVPA